MDLAFFSFVTLVGAGPAEHRSYNEWHQLDHRPENLALPGVAWGDRWARPSDYKAASTAAPLHAETDYVAMYWFREPLDRAVQKWNDLGEDSFQWGRGPLIPGVQRRLVAFFRPVKGYVSPRALVSATALPYRPNRGLQVTLTRFDDPHSLETHDLHAFEDRELIPAILDIEGVAGAWTFSLTHHQRHSSLPVKSATEDAPGSLRIRIVYLDQEPLETTQRITEAAQALTSPQTDGVSEVLFSSPAHTIAPWRDW